VSVISTSSPGFFIKIVISKIWKKNSKKNLEKLAKFGLGKEKIQKNSKLFVKRQQTH
jgi:hypothetical protein